MIHTVCVHIGDVWGGETQQPRTTSYKIRTELVALKSFNGILQQQQQKNQSSNMDFTMGLATS